MADEEAIWYVHIYCEQHGPLTKAKVFELLRAGTLVGSDAAAWPAARNSGILEGDKKPSGC